MQVNKSTIIMCLIATAMAVSPSVGLAQFDTGPAPKSAWEYFKLNPKTKVALNFKNASADMVLQFLSKASGITIIKDPKLTSPITVVSASQVTLAQAFNIVNTALGLQGFSLQHQGTLIIAKAAQQAPAFNPNQFTNQNRQPQSVLKVYKIKYANADQVADVINQVFSSNPSTFNQPNFFFGGGGRFGRGGNQNQNGQSQGPSVKASSDAFSNSVIVNAAQNDQDQVSAIIDQIDVQTDQPLKTQVYYLKYASAQDLEAVIQNVLTTQAPTGRGGVTSQQPNFQQRFQQAMRTGSSQAGFGQVAIDSRSNALVVSATEDNLATVSKVIQELDVPVKSEDDTVVIPLENARADVVAQLLQQAFGNRQGVSGSGYNASKVNNTTVQSRASGTNVDTSISSGAGGDMQPDPTKLNAADFSQDAQNLRIALQDPNATSGVLATEVAVAQNGFFQRMMGGGGGNSSNSNSSLGTVGVGSNGQIINLRDLSGQVTVIPDTNTNSLIIVAPPDYVPAIRKILANLDQIPKQVVIETEIIEANLTDGDQFGIEWKFAQQKVFGDNSKSGLFSQGFGLQSAVPALTGLSYTLSGGDLSAFINFLQTQTKFEVLATPRIFTSNNMQAQINISQRIPYITSTLTNTNGTQTFNYAFQNVGTVLTVTPRITANNYVTMDIVQTADDLQGYTNFNAPIVNQRQANTTVSVQDGRTVLIGGIIQDQVTSTVNKLPLLGDIPILGNLFKSTNKSHQRTELLVLMTPHIISSSADAEKLKDDTVKQLGPTLQKGVDQVTHPLSSGQQTNVGSKTNETKHN